jgi:hypothetical protein
VALICGGGSALLPAPPEGLTLEDEAALNRALLASGAPISAMNAIRKQVSRIKGGRLARAAHPARVVSLVVSDVPGDDPAEVASGPTVADRRDRAAALRAVEAYRIALPDPILRHLREAPEDAPSPDDPDFARDEVRVIASAALSLEAAARAAEAEGIPAVILSDAIEGEAKDVGRVHAAIAREVARKGRPFARPVVILSGGETTVTLTGDGGRGGRNTEFLLSFALGIDGGRDRGAGRRHRRHRRVRGQRGRLRRRHHGGAAAGGGARSGGAAGRGTTPGARSRRRATSSCRAPPAPTSTTSARSSSAPGAASSRSRQANVRGWALDGQHLTEAPRHP